MQSMNSLSSQRIMDWPRCLRLPGGSWRKMVNKIDEAASNKAFARRTPESDYAARWQSPNRRTPEPARPPNTTSSVSPMSVFENLKQRSGEGGSLGVRGGLWARARHDVLPQKKDSWANVAAAAVECHQRSCKMKFRTREDDYRKFKTPNAPTEKSIAMLSSRKDRPEVRGAHHRTAGGMSFSKDPWANHKTPNTPLSQRSTPKRSASTSPTRNFSRTHEPPRPNSSLGHASVHPNLGCHPLSPPLGYN